MNKKIFITLFIATIITMAGLGIIDPILPLYAKSMKATGVQLGIIFAGFALSRSIFAPIVGQYSDRHGRKNFMIAGLILFTVVSVCFVYAGSPLALTLIRLVQGFAVVLVTPVAQAYIGDLTPVGKEGKYMNLFFMSFFRGDGDRSIPRRMPHRPVQYESAFLRHGRAVTPGNGTDAFPRAGKFRHQKP